mgnify:CR=1 FL=1
MMGTLRGKLFPISIRKIGLLSLPEMLSPLVASVSPEWISAYDTYPVTSYNEKLRMLAEAAEKRQALIYCHDAYIRCTTVKRVNTYYKKDKEIPLKKTFLFP